MVTKHFFKILILFIGMIALGLTGIFLANYFDVSKGADVEKVDSNDAPTKSKVTNTANNTKTPSKKSVAK